MQANRLSPLPTLRAGGALLRGALLLLIFRPGLSGQCSARAPACLAFLARRQHRSGR
ncbi:hypothetical protein [Noviherbaspirillum soli]|uniref:hypothetical protein n=1 Tax=Noviherbaspirillum soli TaxID=1064518 RepID=UPI00188A14FC|nr:hypothetical protein [Noviherbaspirillum soli]